MLTEARMWRWMRQSANEPVEDLQKAAGATRKAMVRDFSLEVSTAMVENLKTSLWYHGKVRKLSQKHHDIQENNITENEIMAKACFRVKPTCHLCSLMPKFSNNWEDSHQTLLWEHTVKCLSLSYYSPSHFLTKCRFTFVIWPFPCHT